MATQSLDEPVIGTLRLREGHIKEPIEGIIVYLLLDEVARKSTATPPDFFGTLEALILWVVAGYSVVALYEATRSPESSSDEVAPLTLPDRAIAIGLTVGGSIGLFLVWTEGVSVWAAWVTAIELGPGSGIPTSANGGNPIVWIVIAIVVLEAFTRGLAKLAVRYVWTGTI